MSNENVTKNVLASCLDCQHFDESLLFCDHPSEPRQADDHAYDISCQVPEWCPKILRATK